MLNKKLISLLKKNKKNISKLKIICIGDIILDHYKKQITSLYK